MSNSPGVLARLLGRGTPAPVVSSLALAALNRPLLVHPAMAETVIDAYLTGTITSADTQLASDRVPLAPPAPEAASAGNIGVISVAGALVNRPMPGPSGGGPVSYAALRDAFDEMLADESVAVIVLRLESPGGMASGVFDFTDHVFANRGRKPIHALVDDYAYSAAYAIAAACDEIWVSRTGGVGSVGAAGFHIDRSGTNEKLGVRVTAIYAGARKIDLNPNFPLSDEARDRVQVEMDRLYDLFTQTVATYRGVDVDMIRATEADTFHGQAAVDAGMATRLGTWDDLVASLGAPGVDAPDQAGDDGSEDDAADTATATAEATPGVTGAAREVTVALTLSRDDQRRILRGAMLEAVEGAGLAPELTVVLLESIAAGEDIAARLTHAREVIDLCTAAGAGESAASFIRKNTDIAQVRTALIEAKAEADGRVDLQTTLPASVAAKSTAAPAALDPNAIYSKRGN